MKFNNIIKITFWVLLFSYSKVKSQDSINFYLSESNFAYIGIDNPFKFQTKTYKDDSVLYKCSSGNIEHKNGVFVFKTSLTDPTVFFVYKIQTNDTILIHKQIIKTHKIPDPSIAINGFEIKGSIDETFFQKVNKLDGFVDIDISSLKNSFKVTSFNLRIINSFGNILFQSTSDAFTNEMKAKLKELKVGNRLVFENVILSGPDGTTRYIGHQIKIEIN